MSRSQRIVLMTPSMSKGGAETQLLKLAFFLKSKGDQVLIISLKPINEFKEDFEKSGIEVLFLKSWMINPISNLRALYKRLKDFKPEVVIAFMFVAIIFARLLKIKLGFKLISSIRISVLPAKWYLPFKITTGLDDAVVYNSVAAKQRFEKETQGLKPGMVIHNGIFLPAGQGDTIRKEGLFRWVCVGHFRWNKDYPTLFKAIALIRDQNFRVDILGSLSEATWPARMIEELEIQSKVSLLGFQPEATAYLKEADAFVLSSFSEGMPNAVLEAMAHGLPVLVTDIDGNNELINNAQCGLLFEKQNEYDLAARMLKLMSCSSEERNALGEKGRAYIHAQFSEDRIMERWKELIEEITK